jgi:hypothetical protein
MVKTPRARHSSRKKEPVTIELAPDQVSRLSDPAGSEIPEEPISRPAPSVSPEETTAQGGNEDMATKAEAVEDPGGDRTEPPSSRPGAYYTADDETSSPEITGPAPVSGAASRGGFGRALAAGIAGGVIALVLAGGLQRAGLIPALGNADEGQTLQSLRADVDALEQKVSAIDSGAVDAETIKQALQPANKRIGELAADLDKVKKDVAAARSADASGGSANSASLKSVEDRLAKLEQSLAAASKETPSAQAVDALGRKVDTLGQAAASNSDALGKLQERVSALDGKLAKQADEPNATAAVAASALKSAVERGGSFTAELDMFAAVAPGTPELADLRAFAAKGVPTRARLAAEVGTAAEKMLDATRETPDGDAGIVDRLLSSARSLVRVQPVGKVEGDSVGARIARFRNAVAGGDLAGAAEDYDALPEKAKAAGADFMSGLQARLKVDALAQKALASVLKTG